MAVIAGIQYPKIRCCYGRLTTAQVNGTTQGGTVVLPAQAVTTSKATITCTTVVNADYVTIDGIRFTAATTAIQASRIFTSVGGDAAVAASLAACINRKSTGLPGVTAAVTSGSTVTLTCAPTHPLPVTMTASAGTIVCVAASGNPNITTVGNSRQITVVDGWIRAIGGAVGGGSCTGINVATTGGVAIAVFIKAALTEGAVLRMGTATNGVAANLNLANAPGVGLKIQAVGADVTTATHLDYCIYYTVGKGNTAT